MNDQPQNRYAQRMHRVCDYIDEHLDDALTLEQLSAVAHFSKYHFHRQFAEFMGINLFRYIQLMRLKRASYQLVFEPKMRVIDIALQSGFENPESFSRAFKKRFEQSPSEFRKHPQWLSWHTKYPEPIKRGNPTMQVEIIDFPHTPIAVLEHLGSPDRVNDSVLTFIEWRKQSGLSPVTTSQSFGLVYSDPNQTPDEEFRFDICGSVKQPVPENPQGVINKSIPAGRCAMVEHKGSHSTLENSIYPLYSDWLPESGEQLRDFPLFFCYRNFFPDVAEHELITEIYLPIQ